MRFVAASAIVVTVSAQIDEKYAAKRRDREIRSLGDFDKSAVSPAQTAVGAVAVKAHHRLVKATSDWIDESADDGSVGVGRIGGVNCGQSG